MKYIDTHSHLYMEQFDADRRDVLERMRERDVHTFLVGVSTETSKQVVALAQEEEVVAGAIIGIHPTDTNEKFDPVPYMGLLESGVVVGVGECGFDYYRTPREDVYVHQRENFEVQVQFAVDKDLPLMLHVRSSEGSTDAHDDALEVLRLYQEEHGEKVRGNIHFFTSTKEVARAYLELGFTVAFPGVITFVPELHEVVRDVPLNMMLAETDAPYASPEPHRGKRNEPIFVIDTIKAIADIRGEDVEVVTAQLTQNAQNLFLGKK